MSTEESCSEMDENETEQTESECLQGFVNMEKFVKEGFSVIREAIQCANEFSSCDFEYHSLQKPFKNIMATESNRTLTLMNNILKNYEVKGNFKTSSLDMKEDLLVESIDTILERVGDCIDEINGIKKFVFNSKEMEKSSTSINGSWNRVNNSKFVAAANEDANPSSVLKLLVKDIKRPQELFTDKIDNSNDHPWVPEIKEKPNSVKPLAIFLEETERGEEYSHPYELELEKFKVPEEQLLAECEDPIFPKPLEETPLIEVDTEEKLHELLEDLRKYKIIAIDLEHHSYRTFLGITCLMQISTGETDYLIDTLTLRNKLFVLNEIFTKPSILKVFHGADSDILWLQRDLSLYIVNMFDTHQAAKLLGYSSLSLAYLLERFCNFTPNKHFQMADWRIRPLPEALKKYAREDTHYLIYIYKVMKMELFKKSNNTNKFLSIVYDRSLEICKRRFFKPRTTENAHLDYYGSCKRMFDKRQMYAFKELYYWRDQIARDQDESIGYVLPNHMLLQIAETLPREMQGILACCNPVPSLVRSNLLELHQIILKARDLSVDQPILQDDTRARGIMVEKQEINLDHPFFSPFDLSKKAKTEENAPPLLLDTNFNHRNILESTAPLEKSESMFSVITKNFDMLEKPPRSYKSLTPFQRYNCVKKFLSDEEKQKEEKLKEQANQNNTRDIKVITSEVIEIEEDNEKIYENLDLITNESKTMDEKIEALSNHFSILSQKTKEDIECEKRLEERLYEKASSIITENSESLMEITESRKRQREESDDDEEESENEPQFSNSNPRVKVERTKNPRNKNNKKRNSREFQKKDGHKPDWTQDKSRKRKSEESHSSSEQKKNKYNHQIQNSPHNRRNHGSDRNIEPFDYSSVDFRQFQGGAGEVNKGKTIKSKFQPKKSNKSNKNQNWGKRR
ncbi:exosome component 10-like [Harmonia axyridis]|uniref:exosome component 10-like n=1 Tax=Harmonia axyridis TaxID=115357 RepID=UPI001E2780F1|nr:exosome component 10-like [Harmonia axyridis]XP_045473048.1 exosome component 10-like [Harmonia axyridis]